MGAQGDQKLTRSQYAKEPISVHSKMVTYVSMTALITLCPAFVMFLWHTMVNLDGSTTKYLELYKVEGIDGVLKTWPMPTMNALKIILSFAAFEAFLQLYIPGEVHVGPVSPAGNRPVYKNNGFSCYIITLVSYYGLYKSGYFNPAVVYDHLGEIYFTLVVGSFFVCILLYIKGHVAPSSSDCGSSGNVLVDFYWGMELYPRIGQNFDIKVFTNCRFGMMSWAVLVVTYAIKQIELYGKLSDSMTVSATLMLVYITKFFWWEAGYWNSMDIAHDRAGFYIVWGCLVWVPSVYTSPALYLVNHPVELGMPLAAAITAAGLLCIWINYDADLQRQTFRKTDGKAKVWGKVPNKIVATYVTEKGEKKQSLLLVSGWWAMARHFHYLPEISAAFFWTVPALFSHPLPYFYVVFLTILLVDRAERDDKRCQTKYKKFWDEYKRTVPCKIIPHIF
ncbi:7-dehydrocholesterol reductase [Physcomitrium patens]|uniref:7-dehydrocholesterol reductase n=2 Tax=Physcomitrium patens TaxID=3218 RepID=A0A2K1IG88_PHYPA|nr:7-dehydrocholesterol reductase-like [Physcomitrium patens]PNR28293.1 hypothetical protein PHYPA_028885 [Physcomitrium patens]|eukprot:XP_024364131.1 7-dehydrocholesterol reductase-like [Physcomitrella patens]